MKRKKTSEKDEINYFPGRHFNRNMLIHCESYFTTPNSKAETNYCKIMLSKNASFENRRTNEDCAKFITSNEKRRLMNSSTVAPTATDISWDLLLLRKVQFGNPSKKI